ncbi:hypothetical protein [Mycobacterium haemophilum]|nr:hypothetical protein [Mycobacterium haemophilum]
MANNRYLEVIKRLLGAESYFRWRQEAKEHEPTRPAPEQKPQ